jgi:F-type H+-transporting ATPase subunit delta
VADRATIARPYARAAFAHAQEARDLAAWSKLLGAAAEGAADPRVARLIGNPHVTGAELVELLGGLSKQASTGPCSAAPSCAPATSSSTDR